MESQNLNCQKCSATHICKKEIKHKSDYCNEFLNNIQNDEDRRVLEFIAKNYKGKGAINNDPFIIAVKDLKENRDNRMAEQLMNVLKPILE